MTGRESQELGEFPNQCLGNSGAHHRCVLDHVLTSFRLTIEETKRMEKCCTCSSDLLGPLSSPHVELGASAQEKVVLGDSFMTFFNTHTHTGNLGSPTSPPIEPMSDSLLSQVAKTE